MERKEATSKASAKYLDKKKLLKQDGSYNLVHLKTHLQDEGVLDNSSMEEMIKNFTNIIKNESNYMNINGTTVIIGDIHGQYYDFLKILTKIGDLQEAVIGNILFLGDYVDRGANSVQVITFIMALKINYPKNVFLLRGNHESRCMTNSYNFMRQLLSKYSQNIYQRSMQAFDALPLACLVNKSFFCVHGGISDKMMNIQKINEIDRFKQIPLQGAFCDFIWADPVQIENGYMSQQTKFNQSRQCSIYFGKDLTQKFIQLNSIKSIIRAHEVFPDGFQKYCWGGKPNSEFPTVVTVFSAPNYCGVYGNKGAIIKIQGTNFQIKQYKQQLINNKLHNYLQVFQWSTPQICRVFNQFSKAMMISIFQLYLKEQFAQFKTASPEDKLKVLLDYIKKYTNILQNKNQKQMTEQQKRRASFFTRNSMDLVQQKKAPPSQLNQEKQRMFNRSRDYFRKQHERPHGQ